METVWKVLTRKKHIDPDSAENTELGRVLNTFDLTALGVGSTLGVGVYVLAGHVAKETAGPSVILSFLIATIASVFAGLCYAEFGARVPRAGSAYIYSYVCVGEFIAFVIGWNLILEYVIGSASVARGLSLYLDTLLNNTMKNAFIDIAPIHIKFMSEYVDFFAFSISALLAICLAFGMKESSIVNNIFTLLNIAVVIFVIIAGSIKSNTENWHLKPPANVTDAGEGGFFPFGIEGMIKGAATCFYGFVGFDCIATTGEEVKNPKKAIPFSIVFSLFIIFLAYFGTSTVVTLMVPYYLQDPDAPIPHAFDLVGWEIPKWIVAIGGIFGLGASLFGAMFPLPRIIYAMASDNLIFRILGRVSTRFKTPVIGTLLAGLITGLMAALFDLKQLVNMMSIGTLLAYTIVAASVLILRYTDSRDTAYIGPMNEEIEWSSQENSATLSVLKQIFNYRRQEYPTVISEMIVKFEVCLFSFMCLLLGLCAMYLKRPIIQGESWAIALTALVVCLTVLVVMSIATQPKSRKELSFKVPLVPIIPALSILINIYLMLMLDTNTWIRFGVWMVIGLPTYYFSIQTHSDARNQSISSRSYIPNGKANGFPPTQQEYTIHSEITNDDEKKDSESSQIPTIMKIESTLAALDEILDQEEASIASDRKSSSSSFSSIAKDEDVTVIVHCSDDEMLYSHETNTTNLELVQSEKEEKEEHIDEAQVEVEEDSPNIETIPPTPPPLLLVKDKFDVNIPRPKFRLSEIGNVKLKPIPPVDYSRENSQIERRYSDNIKFGSKQHENFLKELNQKLERGYKPTQLIVSVPKKPVVEKTTNLKNENVIEESVNRDVVKEKLNDLFQRLYLNSPSHSDNTSEDGGKSKAEEIVIIHKEAPPGPVEADISKSPTSNVPNFSQKKIVDPVIKIQNGDIDIKKTDDDLNEDNLKHKENMDSIFKSIRLRKVDSFKTTE